MFAVQKKVLNNRFLALDVLSFHENLRFPVRKRYRNFSPLYLKKLIFYESFNKYCEGPLTFSRHGFITIVKTYLHCIKSAIIQHSKSF